MNTLAYCIPLIHPTATRSWSGSCQRLHETLHSLINASGPTAGIFVGTNRDALLPRLHPCVTTVPLDLPPPTVSVFRQQATSEHSRREAIRLDKGLKLLAAINQARARGYRYVMPVDADDLISQRIPRWVAQQPSLPGWYVHSGWLHSLGSRWVYREPCFHERCGTCFILRIDVLRIPGDITLMPDRDIRTKLGSHKSLLSILSSEGSPLSPLPFPGAIYRVAHQNNASQTDSIHNQYFQRYMLRQRPRQFIQHLSRLRPLTISLRTEFGF